MLDKTDRVKRNYIRAEERSRAADAEYQKREDALDEGLRETFPASDAVMIIQPVPEQHKIKRRTTSGLTTTRSIY